MRTCISGVMGGDLSRLLCSLQEVSLTFFIILHSDIITCLIQATSRTVNVTKFSLAWMFTGNLFPLSKYSSHMRPERWFVLAPKCIFTSKLRQVWQFLTLRSSFEWSWVAWVSPIFPHLQDTLSQRQAVIDRETILTSKGQWLCLGRERRPDWTSNNSSPKEAEFCFCFSLSQKTKVHPSNISLCERTDWTP